MIRRLLLTAFATASLLLATALPGLATMLSGAGDAHGRLGVVYAGDVAPTPTPAQTPALPDGGCQGGGHCGD